MNWIKDLISPETRSWEEFYRNRWQHDKVIRSTHGVNCTGGCSWDIYVKQGIDRGHESAGATTAPARR